MLFKKGERGLQFCLLNLNSKEYQEISKLIVDHGGEISLARGLPVITFSKYKIDTNGEPVFHVDYILECIRRNTLLDLIDFMFGSRGYYGCLMSIFIHGSRQCRYTEKYGFCCTSTHIDCAINKEHNYAQGDINRENCNCSPTASTVTNICDSQEIGDSQYWPDQTSPDRTHASQTTHGLTEMTNSNLVTETPEPSRFEELRLDDGVSPHQLQNQDTNIADNCASEIRIACEETEESNNSEIQPQLPSVNMSEIDTLSVAEEITRVCDLGTDVDAQSVNIPESLRCRRTSPVLISQRSYSSLIRVRKTKCEKASRDKVLTRQEFLISPTILRDESNTVKILSGLNQDQGIIESLGNVENFRLTSSDSDDTVCDATQVLNDKHGEKRRVDANTNREPVSRRDCEIPGPSRSNNVSRVVPEIVDSDTDNVEAQRKKNVGSSSARNTAPNGSNKEKTGADSSTMSTDDSIVIRDSDTDSSSSEDRAGPSSRKTRSHKPSSKKSPDQRQQRKVNKAYVGPVTRNFSHWEQRQMVKYLIDNDCIGEARGNRVWQQAIADGLLPHRTYQSLNNHFRKFILPAIQRFKMSEDHAKQFQKLR